ncbi:MAG: type II secretion system F family protein [Oscillospiraceae bacterium]|nr:type II secretion system F family protein [Oscillospiraceae bacterium]
MPIFKYIALDRSGKKIKSSLEASSIETAKNSLRQTGYTILEIFEPGVMERDIDLPFLGNPTAKDMAIFCRQFLSILRAGVPISQVLTMLHQQTQNKKLSAALQQMQIDIEKGDTLASSMAKHSKIFPTMLVNMVAAGEESGSLDESFRQMEIYFDKAKRTKAAIQKAMAYPMVLIGVMIIVIFVMMTKIIPTFLKSFTEIDIELPAVTLAVMAVSNFFVKWWWLLALLCIAFVAGIIFFRRTNKGMHVFGWLALHIPAVKDFAVRSSCATFCRTLSLLLASGLSLTESLDLVANNMSNIYYKEATQQIASRVSQGWQLHVAIQETGIFPPMVCNLVAIGEESGDIQGMLDKTAEYYDEEVSVATQKLLSLMEPAIMLFLAVFVVIIVLSIFLPMMNMTKAYDSYL